MINILQMLNSKGAIRALDHQFALFIASLEQKNPQQMGFIAGLLSIELSRGHVCLDIKNLTLAGLPALTAQKRAELSQQLDSVDWPQLFAESTVVSDGSTSTPLVFDGERLYLQRYWHYQQGLAERLINLALPAGLDSSSMDNLTQLLSKLFPETEQDNEEINWQKVAAAVALTRKLAVISGGPGTGKTTTVTKLLSALVQQGLDNQSVPEIKLVAPTGKAAARLTESIGNAVGRLDIPPEVREQIPTSASTIHRLLGALPDRAEFRHNQHNPLHLDILVVDEASMVDLPMMYKLISAMPDKARLILLGDKDQLASVEAGAVLGDICSFSRYNYSREQFNQLAVLTGYQNLPNSDSGNPITDSLCMLRKSFRFDEKSGIGQLAAKVNLGDKTAVRQVWKSGYSDISYLALSTESYQQLIAKLAQEYCHYLQELENPDSDDFNRARSALKAFSRCRLLCANREGTFGVSGINMRIEQALASQRKLPVRRELWYHGRPIMVTRNEHSLGLYNGDIGICMLTEDESGEQRLKVFFELADGSVREVLPGRVPEHETAFAMTIHKSQGSEFETTYILLPDEHSPVLTRELIYTGITRAKNKLVVCADEQVLMRAVASKTARLSGLQSALELFTESN